MNTNCLHLLLGLLAIAIAHAGQPHFIAIYTDDQGYGDLGCYGGGHVAPRGSTRWPPRVPG